MKNKKVIKIILGLQRKIDNRISIFIEEILDKDIEVTNQELLEIKESLNRAIDEDFEFIKRI